VSTGPSPVKIARVVDGREAGVITRAEDMVGATEVVVTEVVGTAEVVMAVDVAVARAVVIALATNADRPAISAVTALSLVDNLDMEEEAGMVDDREEAGTETVTSAVNPAISLVTAPSRAEVGEDVVIDQSHHPIPTRHETTFQSPHHFFASLISSPFG